MKLFGNSRIALSYMFKKPLRTFLVLQGIIWAVAIAIFPHSIQEGSVSKGSKKPSEYGLNTVTLYATGNHSQLFSLDEPELLMKKFPSEKVEDVTAARLMNGQISIGDGPVTVQFVGTDEHTPNVRAFNAEKGRYLRASDIAEKRNVCVLEWKVAEELFGGDDPLGKKVMAQMGPRELELEVIGVMEKRSYDRLNTDELGFRYKSKQKLVAKLSYVMGLKLFSTEWKRTETCVHVPITLMPGDTFNWMIVKTDPAKASIVAAELQSFLLKQGKEVKAFSNIVFPIMLESRLKIRDELTMAVFVVCLLLGGVMIMNIMLLSVMERYREIAIRRVEGASKKDIIFQFLTEGAVLCLVAAVLGIPLGLLMGHVTARAEPWAIASVGIPWKQLPISTLCPIAIGLLSALLPARKAAGIDPAVILRQK